jgi:hypothetical protein
LYDAVGNLINDNQRHGLESLEMTRPNRLNCHRELFGDSLIHLRPRHHGEYESRAWFATNF